MITKCQCGSCGNGLEFELEHEGTMIDCPHCGEKTILKKAKPAKAARVIRKTEFVGVSSLVQLVGLVLLFFFPIGTIMGVVLIVVGSSMSVKWACSACGNRVADKGVRLCPCCQAPLAPAGFF